MNIERIKADYADVFFKLVQHNDIDGIQKLLHKIRQLNDLEETCANIVNFFILSKSGDSALHICARLGPEYLNLFRYLVKDENANIEQQNIEGKTALHDAAQFSNLPIVQFLLQKGANSNVVKRADWTPLMLACTKQDVAIVDLLLSAGADLNFVNKDGWNCLHLAAREGNIHIVKMLLKIDPINRKKNDSCNNRRKLSQVQSKNGRRPLHTAVMHGHLQVSELLIDDDDEEGMSIVDNCGTTPLMDSCRFGHLELLRYLVDKRGGGRNLFQDFNKQGQNCLHIAAEAGQSTVVRELVEIYEADVNEVSKDDAKMMSLHWAAKEGHVETIRILLELNANPGIKDGKDRTAHDLAITFGHSEAAQLLS